MGLVLRTLSEVSAVMNALSACDPDRTAVVDRGPLPCVGVAWGRALARAGKLPPHHPANPCSFAAAIASLSHRKIAPLKTAERCHAQKNFRCIASNELREARDKTSLNVGRNRKTFSHFLSHFDRF